MAKSKPGLSGVQELVPDAPRSSCPQHRFVMPFTALALLLCAAQHNQESLSNGSLMRVTPLAVWAHKQPVDVIAQHAMAEAALTHPNKTAHVLLPLKTAAQPLSPSCPALQLAVIRCGSN
jgi:hypothetical protein